MRNIRYQSRSRSGPQAPNRVRAQIRGWIGLVAMSLLFASGVAQAEAGQGETLIDLNRATAEQLMELPGIGASKAAAIVEYRDSSGAFDSLEDLEAVRGIGPALIVKLRPHVKLGSSGKSTSPSKAATKSRPTTAK